MRAEGLLSAVAGLVIAASCADSQASGIRPPAGAVVDSARPVEEALGQFREGRARPAALIGGERSREALVGAFATALERQDTTALRRLVLDASEFAWLYYPSSPMSRPPYELPPDVLWFQMQGQNERGASRLFAERAGTPLGVVGHECRSQRAEGENRIHGHCVVWRVTAAGDTVGERLFGLIVERGGTFKFVSYANKLD